MFGCRSSSLQILVALTSLSVVSIGKRVALTSQFPSLITTDIREAFTSQCEVTSTAEIGQIGRHLLSR